MKILSSGDWHINLRKKKEKVPYDWQLNRFKKFFESVYSLEKSHDIHIVSGDMFDKKPEPDEMTLFLEFVHSLSIPTFFIPGNHCATKKGETFLEFFLRDKAFKNDLATIITKNTNIDILGTTFQFFPYGEMQIDNLPEYIQDSVLITHIRGEVKPHITAEYDFSKLAKWKLVLLGDLHFNHQYNNMPVFYPGSPMNVSFDRDETRKYGVDSIDFNSVDDYSVKFIPLNLPKLIRRTVNAGEELVPGDYDHVIYEVVGKLDEMANISASPLLDKKIIKSKSTSKLNFNNMTKVEKLEKWLEYINVKDKESIMLEYKAIGINENNT